MHVATAQAPRDYIIRPKERSKKMKYAIGMIVTCCNRHATHITGVIIDWNEIYNSEVNIEPEHRLLYSHSRSNSITLSQPFYTVLSDNGNMYYTAEDSLIEAYPPRYASIKSINHNEIGRYF